MPFLGQLTGLIAVILIFGMPVIIVGTLRYFRSRDNADLQKTLRMSIESGQALPPEFIETLKGSQPRPKSPINDIRNGLIIMAIGGGLAILAETLLRQDNTSDAFWPLIGIASIPGLIGFVIFLFGLIGLATRKK